MSVGRARAYRGPILPEQDREARVALSRLGEPGGPGMTEVVATHGAVLALERLVTGAVDAKGVIAEHYSFERLQQDLQHTDQMGARVVIPSDEDWPRSLNDLAQPPLCLWVRGPADLDEAAGRSVSIVGARSATSYGTQVAADLAAGLGQRGFAVVSGAAFGIDAAAHRGSLAVDACTVAVLAGGIDRLYPSSHAQLLAAIARTGAVISEQPPGVAPIGSRFLKRNRIIAAISCGTVVVEASLRSGSLNTATHALDIARPVGAVPGPVTSMQSAGCHQLIRDKGVVVVTDVDEVADLMGRLGLDLAPAKRGRSRPIDALEPEDRALFEALPIRSHCDIEVLSRAAGLTTLQVRAGLGRLELRDLATSDGLDRWRKAPAKPRTRT